MNSHITNQTLTLVALAATLGGKQIKLNGISLNIHTMAASQEDNKARLLIETSLASPDDPDSCSIPDCQCPVCQMSRAIPSAIAAEVISLLCQGVSDHFILDSLFVSNDGFHVKIRNLKTQRVAVGNGPNNAIAIGRAVQNDSNPNPEN